ncbi:MAG: DUF2950 domain-containing protein [Candidatus Methanoperedens sp.]|nr:DUF2950 domain-containing protein [Candidatus Methanoperedens sp.]
METRRQKSLFRSSRGMVFIAALFVCAAFIVAWSMPIMAAASQKLFSTPEDALKGLVEAVKIHDKAALDQIFGPSSKDLLSGDAVQDAAESEEFASHLAEKTSLVKENDSKVIISIGNENWPFPIPLVKTDGQWHFDTEAGKEEILNRRIGEDELTAILVCRTYVKAQREYVLQDWDGDGILAYAQKLRSDPGKKNGLFWRHAPGEPISPLGELVAQARMAGYKKEKSLFKEQPIPFHGYYFKILTRQGKNAPGGKYNYIINGNMVGGFALVAFPSNWGKSGVMTFIVNQQGKVYQKNLGPDTLKMEQAVDTYDPDKTWTPVKE